MTLNPQKMRRPLFTLSAMSSAFDSHSFCDILKSAIFAYCFWVLKSSSVDQRMMNEVLRHSEKSEMVAGTIKDLSGDSEDDFKMENWKNVKCPFSILTLFNFFSVHCLRARERMVNYQKSYNFACVVKGFS